MLKKISHYKAYGEILPEAEEQAVSSLKDGNIVRLMADHHIGYGVPIGGVIASDKISLNGVGFDIGCGNSALKLNLKLVDIQDDLISIAKDISKLISFGIGRANNQRVEHPFFDDPRWSNSLISKYKELALTQFGTVGSGNHYVDILSSQNDNSIYIANHFGSRGFGHKLASYFFEQFGAKDSMMSEPVYADLDTELGRDYLFAMEVAGDYARLARDWVVNEINQNIFKAEVVQEIHNHHNYSWRETHFGTDYWVTRKGATPLYLDSPSFIGGSMATNSYIVRGLESEQYYDTLRSTVHGAGRMISRSAAAGNRKGTKKGLFSDINLRQFSKDNGIILIGGGADELPMCYKDIDSVIAYHKESLIIEDILTPKIVLMAGKDEYDPYKD